MSDNLCLVKHTRNVSRTDYSPISFFFVLLAMQLKILRTKSVMLQFQPKFFGQPVRTVKHPEFRTSPPRRDGNMHVSVLWLTTVPYSLRLRVRDMMMSHSLILSSAFPS